jgi:hypothetical protein
MNVASLKTVLAIVAFVVSGFCLMETLAGIVISCLAYVRGPIRGVPFHAFAQTTLIFLIVAGIVLWAALMIRPKRSA